LFVIDSIVLTLDKDNGLVFYILGNDAAIRLRSSRTGTEDNSRNTFFQKE
jgi:hypothetical protein